MSRIAPLKLLTFLIYTGLYHIGLLCGNWAGGLGRRTLRLPKAVAGRFRVQGLFGQSALMTGL